MNKLLNRLASRIAKEEGGNSEAKIGDIRQILKALADEINRDPLGTIGLLTSYAVKRSGKKRS